ncbi:GntR family transcriptional regulator [Pseudarthrobacter niigatensis]|uniref:DNA-binding GntR family transcriptional regulator n=1 Tax=Pseudarthrobacter niigatensis TaxID=369935 RepID=A0AAJ1WFN9_9MICC|nr:GntR family transcriptional regulator [Pseudarthrobacter niigatensis]MDQ0144658.1 DNA-binding GntR family transcriptional regulator [Pseudarthrobacter niigatensis]MDQ0265304.1 DNA-binding GntR family transcriptional regulator [Pseudarthrobacter niigatensis]
MTMSEMQVLRHAPIREQVASILRNAIVEMRFAPGQLLIERQLCEMTAASRASVREALRLLEAEGLVESQNGKGTHVSVVSPELAGQVYVIRANLEGLAAELFTLNADQQERERFFAAVDELATAVEQSAGADHTHELLQAKNRVYEALFNGTHNPILQQMVEMLQRRVTQLRALTLAQPGRPQSSLAEIQEIRSAIENRNASAARALASDHVKTAAGIVLGALKNSPQTNDSMSS